jgi:hypothetical protein
VQGVVAILRIEADFDVVFGPAVACEDFLYPVALGLGSGLQSRARLAVSMPALGLVLSGRARCVLGK